MALVKINALEIPPQAGDEIVKRFSARMEAMEGVDGFEGFELLRPTGDAETRWFVYTRWTDQASYDAWRDGDGARNAHAQGGGGAQGEEQPQRPPVSMGATLLEFEVELKMGGS